MAEKELTWDEFEKRLIAAGWKPADAHRERLEQEFGYLGDCDGDMDL